MVFGQSQLLGHVFGHLLAVSGQHHRTVHTQCMQGSNRLGTIRFYLVVNHNMARIGTVYGHVDNRTRMVTVVPLGTDGIHQFGVTYSHLAIAHLGYDALSGHLAHIAHLAAIRSLVGECITQGRTNGMSRKVLHMSRQVQQLVIVDSIRMHGRYGKFAVSERTRLVKHHRTHLRQHIHVVGPLD